ncbi:hypothetical protein [Antrihabitans stalactiti]|uniref:Uncharacterized protein n=1 Tax=Antrihabitans stalactiti TaxID=2584121 RepID=A0A848KG52_9NOCA|nr:hypothetical protein [Antrihabitans stalactiti]NMN94917.1 hypothetical protein [Antrihabitans stalactiti]
MTVDIAGTAWPVYKLEAIAAGLAVFLVAMLIVGSMQVAVLGASALAAGVWLVGSVRQATRA